MTLIPSIIMNDLRWTDKTCDNTDEIIPYYYLSIDYLKSFLGKRLAFLNDAWINGTEYVNIYIQIDGDSQYSRLSVPKGTTISQEILDRLYSYSYDGASVPRGLYYMEYTELEDGKMYFVGNEVPFDPSLPLWEDIDLYYLWDSP